MITTVLVAYNEHDMLPYQLHSAWEYSDRVIVFDNMSTDDTVALARRAFCEVVHFDTGGEVRDDMMTFVLNSAHERVSSGWIFTHAVDEIIYSPLGGIRDVCARYENAGYNAIQAYGFNMIGEAATLPDLRIIEHVRDGLRDGEYFDKLVGYRKGITPNYLTGCHGATPTGDVHYAPTGEIYLLHYKFGLGLERIERRNATLIVSDANRRNGWAWHIKQPGKAKEDYEYLRSHAVKVF